MGLNFCALLFKVVKLKHVWSICSINQCWYYYNKTKGKILLPIYQMYVINKQM